MGSNAVARCSCCQERAVAAAERRPLRCWLLRLCLMGMAMPNGVSASASGFTSPRANGRDSVAISPNEQAFLQIPTAQSARASLRVLTSHPHVAGTEGDHRLAEFVRQTLFEAGIPQVSIENLVVKLNYPDFGSNKTNASLFSSSSLSLWETIDEDAIGSETKKEKNSSNKTDGSLLQEEHLRKKTSARHTPPSQQQQQQQQSHKRKLVFRASLSEDLLDPRIDPTTDTIWRNHTFHGYSPSGSLSHTRFVYGNYGRPQDFEVLHRSGISVAGSIVLMRYGKCFRGLKVRNAQERGAVGVLLYSDPADDGNTVGAVYPQGPWRPPAGVQRGSVQFNSVCGGDPYRADPRYRAVFGTSVQELCNVTHPARELIPSIPSLPIGYGDARPLLENLGGAPVAEIPGALENDFVGGLTNLTYRIGPSKGFLDLTVRNADATVTVPNVVGVIPGSLPPHKDQPVLLGNHRDAWVYGAADPNSGTAALLEVAKGLGRLYTHHHWRPRRSIYLLSWSGEEYGLLGSTGWAELNMMVPPPNSTSSSNSNNSDSANGRKDDSEKEHSTFAPSPVLRRSLAYLNTDTVVSGDHLQVSASPTLFTVWEGVISDLQTKLEMEMERTSTTASSSMLQTRTAASRFLQNVTMVDANSAREILPSITRGDNGEEDAIGVLGSGSDYTVFLDHFGIPSLDFSFNNRKAHYGQYHSIYDSFAWMDRFGGSSSECDGDNASDNEGSSFELMAFAAKVWGLLAIRLSDSPMVLLDHVSQGKALKGYISILKDEIANITKDSIDGRNTGSIRSAMDPTRSGGAATKFVFRMKNLTHAVESYAKNAAQLHLVCSEEFSALEEWNAITSNTTTESKSVDIATLSETVESCNEKLGLTERYLLLEDGLPGRPWFRHCLQAPGLDLGYAAESFPGIQQALDQTDYPLAQDQIDKAAEQILAAANNLVLPHLHHGD